MNGQLQTHQPFSFGKQETRNQALSNDCKQLYLANIQDTCHTPKFDVDSDTTRVCKLKRPNSTSYYLQNHIQHIIKKQIDFYKSELKSNLSRIKPKTQIKCRVPQSLSCDARILRDGYTICWTNIVCIQH